jgi:hypothetical protein
VVLAAAARLALLVRAARADSKQAAAAAVQAAAALTMAQRELTGQVEIQAPQAALAANRGALAAQRMAAQAQKAAAAAAAPQVLRVAQAHLVNNGIQHMAQAAAVVADGQLMVLVNPLEVAVQLMEALAVAVAVGLAELALAEREQPEL